MKAGLDNDRLLDKALKQALAVPTDVPPSEACLDAETLAAWMDDGLDPAAVALAEAHVSSCARCQALVGAMTRSAPEVPVSGHAPSSFWRWWLAPVAAAAAATVVWMVVPDQRGPAPLNPPAEEVAQAPSTGDVAEPLPPASLSAPPPPAVAPGRPAEDTQRQERAADASAVRESSKRIGETRSTESAQSRQPSAERGQAAGRTADVCHVQGGAAAGHRVARSSHSVARRSQRRRGLHHRCRAHVGTRVHGCQRRDRQRLVAVACRVLACRPRRSRAHHRGWAHLRARLSASG